MSSNIILSTLNASYHHSAFGLRYLKSNLGALEEQCQIIEYTIHKKPQDIATELVTLSPNIIGFGVYIWNTTQTQEVIQLIKQKAPHIIIVLGGPEVSYESQSQEIVKIADFVICGEADFSFRHFCENYLLQNQLPDQKIIRSELPEINELKMPYSLYSDDDIKNRTIYVEASRGCPYKCEYCLSSLDKSVRNFPILEFLKEMDILFSRGVRQFKFIDRTFNLSPTISQKILQFFLEKIEVLKSTKSNTFETATAEETATESDKNSLIQEHSDGLFLHFEMVPDRLPDELKRLIQLFPAGSLQFEIGVQTWNEDVAALVSRRQDYKKVEENLKFLRDETHVHTHVDLIGGLPGETLESFQQGFDRLARLGPDEIQVGVLKRLKGTPIIRHDKNWDMIYSTTPPFQILSTKTMPAPIIEKFTVFAKFWDLIANRGHFKLTCELINEYCNKNQLSLFVFYWQMSEHLLGYHKKTYSIPLDDLFKSVLEYLQKFPMNALPTLHKDYHRGERYYTPSFLRLPHEVNTLSHQENLQTSQKRMPKRQAQHLI